MTKVWGPELNYMPDYWPQWLKVAAIVLVVVIAVMIIHYILRMIMNKRTAGEEEKQYLYKLPVRLWHWTNAVLFLCLLVTGILNHFNMGPVEPMVAAHKLLGIIFIVAWVYFILVNMFSSNGRNYIIQWPGFIGRCITQAKFYLFGIIKGEAHPFEPEEGNKFNPLQQPSYIGVVYVLIPVMIMTGLISLLPDVFGKHPGALTVHFFFALVGLLFLLVHLYMCTGGAYLTQIVKGMIDGYSRHEKHPEK